MGGLKHWAGKAVWATSLVSLLASIAVVAVGCDRTHELFIVNETDTEIVEYWDGIKGITVPSGATGRDVALLRGVKHQFEARDRNGNVVYRIELTETQLEQQNWTIRVTSQHSLAAGRVAPQLLKYSD